MIVCCFAALGIPQSKLFAQAKLVEKVSQKGEEVIIPYEKYVLPNGLTVLIHEDHSDPIVHVDVTYHVGSAREEINKSGFAHFFEHMMFQGSDNVGDEQHFKIITEAGGTLNGTTNRDRTNYFETVPANQLEKMLWLESDRMGFLLDAVTQEKFEVQRATVKNERGQRYDNQPYGLVREFAAKNLYSYGHPYSWLTIGYIEDLNRVNVQDLKNFFLRWYGPNNAVLTIGGDVNPKQALKWVEQYFGSIPKGPEVKTVTMPAPVLEKDRYVSFTDNYAKLPMLQVIFPTTPQFSKDEPALDCLSEIIGQGKNSLLYKNLVKANKAVNAYSYNSTSELAGEFTIAITPYPGQKLSDMENIMRESFNEFEERGVTDKDIETFRGKNEAQIVYQLESVAGKVGQLAAFYTYTGNANYTGTELKRYESVTKEDVMRVYNQYIKGKHAVIVSVLTKTDEDNKAATDNYKVENNNYSAPDYGYDKLTYNKGKDKFDRSKTPKAQQAVIVKAPLYWESKLAGENIKMIGTESNEIPVVNILINLKGGKFLDAPEKTGTAALFAAMMNEDTRNYSSEAFELALKKLGSSINISVGNDDIKVMLRSLDKNLDAALSLLKERLLAPAFHEDDFERNKKRTIENIKNSANIPANVASIVYNSLLMGADNPIGKPVNGFEKTVNNIELSDIQEYYQNSFSKNDMEVVVVGSISEKEIKSKLGFLTELPDNKIQFPELPAAPIVTKEQVYFVDIPGAAQSEFRIGYASNLKYDATGDFYKSGIMNYPLGGAFNSRLNLYLREEKGWTYGARSGFSGDQYSGSYSFSAGIKASATDSALSDILRILNDYKTNGISAEELAFTKNSLTQSEARNYETGFQKAGFLNKIQTYNLDKNFTEKQNEILNKMTIQETNSFVKKYLPSQNKLVVLIVGDKATLADKIKEKGFEIVEVDKEGNLM